MHTFVRASFRVFELSCVNVHVCVFLYVRVRACWCVLVVWEGKKENRYINREGECRVGRALVSLASRPPPRVCNA